MIYFKVKDENHVKNVYIYVHQKPNSRYATCPYGCLVPNSLLTPKEYHKATYDARYNMHIGRTNFDVISIPKSKTIKFFGARFIKGTTYYMSNEEINNIIRGLSYEK